ncbi:glycoside hydrolase family 32 protein [Pseudarthrobacter sulfonivorans]|uniref:glycoside hydrolase family 32 protein n=1 Tax=Pseudarthrobacter sulfonivorans TaxID=121292 RepID=UPI002861D4D8|nr:glycoside hydrolase family 32 protein [Pseudarthrobacter sulfonivorans]MDR6414552.1 levanase/levanbiose-producing levanase [Pseudarthrobacter sulfonivorans]
MSSCLDDARPETAPAGTPHLRPALHYTARDTWLNDPNGLVFYRGTYHLFYQNNPHGDVWGNMSWGHATSTDLVHWIEQPVAIACDDAEDIFSGSIVVDHTNSSGFGNAENPPLVAIYTSAYKPETAHEGTQAQSLAYSNDAGMTWTKFTGNPVLTRRSANFRDPKVFSYPHPDGPYWVMVAVEAGDQTVVFYRSADLRLWELASEFGPANAAGGEWECPDLFPLPVDGDPDRTKWVLVVNVNPGAVAGGSGGQYFVGDFDGVTFTPDPSSLLDSPVFGTTGAGSGTGLEGLRECRWLDWGRDYYAAVSFSNVPNNRRLMIGWLNNWDYANSLPTFPWRSGMSLVREVALETVGGRPSLAQAPILPPLNQVQCLDGRELHGVLALPEILPGEAQVIDAEILPGTAEHCGFRLWEDADGGAAVIDYDPAVGVLSLDRTAVGDTTFHTTFASVDSAPVPLEDGVLTLRIVVDHCSVEVFAQGGKVVLTDLVFPRVGTHGSSVFVKGGKAILRKLAVATVG